MMPARILVASLLVASSSRPAAASPSGGASPPAPAPQPHRVRSLAELIDQKEPGISLVRRWIHDAKNPVKELKGTRAAGERALLALQVTSGSPMGAIALETGGLLIDHGWVRVLGGGSAELPRTIPEWNGIAEPGSPSRRLPGTVVVADDVIGGFFAVNGGGLKGERGHVFYHAPETLEWTDVAPSYSEWLWGMLTGDLEKFYEGLRWPGWQKTVESLKGDRGLVVYPFLFEGTNGGSNASRKPVPITELWTLYVEEAPRQLKRK